MKYIYELNVKGYEKNVMWVLIPVKILIPEKCTGMQGHEKRNSVLWAANLPSRVGWWGHYFFYLVSGSKNDPPPQKKNDTNLKKNQMFCGENFWKNISSYLKKKKKNQSNFLRL